jgi:uncharacterized membrane protein
MRSERFRRQLRQESERWQSEGLIDADLYAQLSVRYQFERLEGEANGRFILILLGLGSILLGLAAITFVAANWQVWDRSLKVALLLGCFVGVNAAGFYLWRGSAARRLHRLGHGLLLLGAMLLGANIGLMSQLFHQSGSLNELLVVWGLGVVAMAYSLRLGSLGIMGLILLAGGYWAGMFEAMGFAGSRDSVIAGVLWHAPVVVGLVFVPLAYWCRSRPLFTLTAIAASVSLLCNLLRMADWNAGWMMALAFVLPPLLLWGFGDRAWRYQPLRRGAVATSTPPGSALASGSFQPLARSVAVCFLSVLFYLLAFQWWWGSQSAISYGQKPLIADPLIDAAILALVAGVGWLQLRQELFGRSPQAQIVNSRTVLLCLVLTAGIFLSQQHLASFTFIPIMVFNALLFLLALGLIGDGLTLAQRHTFWGGMVLLVLGIMGRMLEYNTDLLFKSFVFALCGVGIIVAGLWFERSRSRQLPRSSG